MVALCAGRELAEQMPTPQTHTSHLGGQNIPGGFTLQPHTRLPPPQQMWHNFVQNTSGEWEEFVVTAFGAELLDKAIIYLSNIFSNSYWQQLLLRDDMFYAGFRCFFESSQDVDIHLFSKAPRTSPRLN